MGLTLPAFLFLCLSAASDRPPSGWIDRFDRKPPVQLSDVLENRAVGFYAANQDGLHGYDNLLINEAMVNIYYVGNLTHCATFEAKATNEWLDDKPSPHNHFSEEQAYPAKQEGGNNMDP